MDAVKEIILVTENSTNQQCTVSAWDSTTKNSLHVYKGGGIAGSRTLDRIGTDFVITGDNSKPLLHLWQANSQDEVREHRFVIPGIAGAVAVCPNSVYLCVGIGPKVYVWHLASGRLLAVEQKHFQPVTCIRFSSDGDFVVVGGGDGALVVWKLCALISMQNNDLAQSEMGRVKPVYAKMDHTAPISDMNVGVLGNESTIVTVSHDKSANIYKLATGVALLRIVFSDDLLAVATDNLGWNVYLGTRSGVIHQVQLLKPPRSVDFHASQGSEEIFNFVGHEKSVTCVSLSRCADVLVSGGNDCKVILWDTISRNLLYTISFKGSISNLKFCLGGLKMFAQDFKATVCLQTLQRSQDFDNENFVVALHQRESISLGDDLGGGKSFDSYASNNYAELQNALQEVKGKNYALYQMGVELIKKIHNDA